MTGYSLHIGLNHVDPNCYDGWDGALSGCINDANSMLGIAQQMGFHPTQLLDGQATSAAVIGEIALIAQQACPGDICLITYSGHGGQVDDFNGDDEDSKDETWVLYDRQVVDDELAQMWTQFPAGVRILVLSDSCHSGTVARSMIATESRKDIAKRCARSTELENVTATVPKHMPYDVQHTDNEQRRGTYQFVQALSGSRSGSFTQASLILISGCQDNQLSYDGAVNGQFTGTLLNVWQNGSFQGDYNAFHRAILSQMPPDQSPNLYTVGPADPAFLGQKPFTVAAPVHAPVTPTTPAPTVSSSRPLLSQGSVGPDVAYLQQRLNAHGASLPLDSVFGPATRAAVVRFQSAHGLVADGRVGAMTWNALDNVPIGGGAGGGGGTVSGGAAGGGATSSGGGATSDGGGTTSGGGGTTVAARPLVRRGSTGEHVSYLQGRLLSLTYHVTVDGIFGPGTESAVRSFQRSNGLTADGVVGSQTWAALG